MIGINALKSRTDRADHPGERTAVPVVWVCLQFAVAMGSPVAGFLRDAWLRLVGRCVLTSPTCWPLGGSVLYDFALSALSVGAKRSRLNVSFAVKASQCAGWFFTDPYCCAWRRKCFYCRASEKKGCPKDGQICFCSKKLARQNHISELESSSRGSGGCGLCPLWCR